MTIVKKFGVFAIALWMLVACQPEYIPIETNLAGTSWTLSSLNSSLPLQGSTVTVQFGEDGSISGTDGCNSFSGTFTEGEGAQDGSDLTIDTPIASTMMACTEPVMNQATAYMSALAATTRFTATESQLMLLDGEQIVATFVAVSSDMVDTLWQVTAYNNGREAVVSLIIGTDISANFSADGQVTGNAGCNEYFASYTAEDGTMRIGAIGTTFRLCDSPPGVMEQESEYLAALSTVATYGMEGNVMVLRTADDAAAVHLKRTLEVDLPAPEPATPRGRVVALHGVNVRSGPGTNYPTIAVAQYGDEGEIIGRSADKSWWAVSVPAAPEGIGWVSVSFVTATNVEGIPVLEPAPIVVAPPVDPPPATPTAVPSPTATPAPELSFSASRTTIEQGECVTLNWSVEHVQSVWVYPRGEAYERFPRGGQGSEDVCPATTTTYEMRVLLREGATVFQEVTITVNPGPDAELSLWAERTNIDAGECTRLNWNVENVRSVWVYPRGEPYDQFPRGGQDSEEICPETTTTYEMRVLLRDGSTVFREVTVNVRVPEPTPQPTLEPTPEPTLEPTPEPTVEATVEPTAEPTPEPTADAAEVPDPLSGTRWNVVQFNNFRDGIITLLPDTSITMDFGADGQLSGSAGCNNYSTAYETSANSVAVGAAAATAQLCAEPEGIMEQEAQFLAALQATTTFRITGDTLELSTEAGQIAIIAQRVP